MVPSRWLIPGQFLAHGAKDVGYSTAKDRLHPPPAPTIQRKLHPFSSTYVKVQDNYQTNQRGRPLPHGRNLADPTSSNTTATWNDLPPSQQFVPGQFCTRGAKNISKYTVGDRLHPSLAPTIHHKSHPPHPTYVEMQDCSQSNQQGKLPTRDGNLAPPPYSNMMSEEFLTHGPEDASKPILTTTELPFLSSPSLIQCNQHLSGSTYVLQDYHRAHQWGQLSHIEQPSVKSNGDVDEHIAASNVPSPQPTPLAVVNGFGCHTNGAQLVNGNGNSNYRYPPSMMLHVGTPCQPGTKGKMLLPMLCQEAC